MGRKIQNYLLIGILILLIVGIIAIIYIWFFSNSNTESNADLGKYTLSDFKSKTYDIYSNEVKRLLLPQNTQQLYEKMQSSFLTSQNLNESNFKSYLEQNNLISKNIVFTSYSVIEKNDIYVYRINYNVNDDNGNLIANKVVNVIEEKPYSYTISFDQESVSLLESYNISRVVNNIRFDIVCLNSSTESIKFKIVISNDNDKDVIVNFDNVSDVVLILDDNTFVKMAASVVSGDNETLTKGSSITKEAFFPIGLQDQGQIKSISFGNVKIGNVEEVITLDF